MISIIIPIYNAYEYLDECIKSALGQTYSDLEIILIDDGSTDGSEKIVDDYSKKDNRIIVKHQMNQGPSSARNIGMEIASGEWVFFLDSDDMLMPQAMEIMLSIADVNEVEMVMCGYSRSQNINVNYCYDVKKINENIKIKSGRDWLANEGRKGELYYPNVNIVCCNLMNRNLIGKLKFPPGRFHEDSFLAYKLIYKAKKATYISEPLYYYRVRQESRNHTRSIYDYKDALDALFEKRDFYMESNDMILYRKQLMRF